ncbi:hypothetical protein ALMA_0199 [Alloscardovia macacae]|uniref:Uncharacterized protein n=1 Tax=Alloscardovia macacae TaxID=1160091 RepID=A0A261F715_9BIFI|nr:hypothetical protein ALMA_0199 [Alloscardovia macacae]
MSTNIIISWLGEMAFMINGGIAWTLYFHAKHRKKQVIITVVGTILLSIIYIAMIINHVMSGS